MGWLRQALSPLAIAIVGVASALPTTALALSDSLAQRLASARESLATVDAGNASSRDAQIRAVERLFDLLDEAEQLETAEAQNVIERDLALRADDGSIGRASALERQARLLYSRRRVADAALAAERALALQRGAGDDVADASIRATLGVVRALHAKFGDGATLLEDAITMGASGSQVPSPICGNAEMRSRAQPIGTRVISSTGSCELTGPGCTSPTSPFGSCCHCGMRWPLAFRSTGAV